MKDIKSNDVIYNFSSPPQHRVSSWYIDYALIPFHRVKLSPGICQGDLEWEEAGMIAFKEDIDQLPKADVTTVIHGKDISDEQKFHCEFMCSVCGSWAGSIEYGTLDGGDFNYCPACGAKLDLEDLLNERQTGNH